MKIAVCLMLTITWFYTVKAQEDRDADDVMERFYGHRLSEGQSCNVRDRLGVCKRRSRCRFPSNRICRRGLNPIVCCMDETAHSPVSITDPPKLTTTRRPIWTTKRIQTTRKPPPASLSSEETNDVEITFPDCGTRRPKNSEPQPQNPPPNQGRRRGGLFGGRRGRRSIQIRMRRGLFNPTPVIVGGVTARPNSWPWMVAIFKKDRSSRFLCGGSLISKKYILTAAHCFSRNDIHDPSKFFIKVGAHTTDDGKAYNVESMKIHPKYRDKFHYNDIALLKVEEVTLGNKVHPVCLPSRSLRSRIGNTRKNVTVTGWGDKSFGGPSSKQLQEVELPIVPVKQCNESYYKIASQIFPQGINQLFMCAGFKDGGKDACQGDSGGPLTMEMDGGRYVQLGVVSFGMGCAEAGFPGVYTRISQFTGWIHDNTDLGHIARTQLGKK